MTKTLSAIHGKISHVFGPILQLWGIMKEEKKASLQKMSENNDDCSPVLSVPFLFEQSILLLGQVFNTTSYFQRKNVLKTHIDGKFKVKEILIEQPDCLNYTSNQFLLGECFENEFSENVNAKKKVQDTFHWLTKAESKNKLCYQTHSCKHQTQITFSGLAYYQQQPLQGCPLQRRPRCR